MEGKIFEVQPDWCRKPLPFKENLPLNDRVEDLTSETVERIKRVLFFDPTETYQRIGKLISPYQRYTSVPMGHLFPTITKGICACGCKRELTEGRRRWATDECKNFADAVWCIIAGVPDLISRYLNYYYGYGCMECGERGVELDHKHGIKFGGGGAWLSNYQHLCSQHHRKKTNEDFGWKDEIVKERERLEKEKKKREEQEEKQKHQFKLEL